MTPEEDSPLGRPPAEVLGVRFHALTRREAARAIAHLARSGRRAYVVKPYSEFMPQALRDEPLRRILDSANLCLADGVGILWAAHYLSLRGGRLRALAQFPLSLIAAGLHPGTICRPLPQAMAGVDLTWRMMEEMQALDVSVFLLGGTEREMAGARAAIEQRLPGLRIAGARDGYFGTKGASSDEVAAEINASGAQALLVAMGFPRQERWIAHNLHRLEVNVAVAEGGSFSFMSGAVRRAPRWVRRLGLEWLYRLARQPWRLRRQLAIPAFIWLVLRERLGRGSRDP